MSTHKTRVLFRRYSSGEVVALFPFEPGAISPFDCSSYGQGQHSAADPRLVVDETRPATRQEYAGLARELRRIGYRLEIGRRLPRNAYQVRLVALETYIAKALSP